MMYYEGLVVKIKTEYSVVMTPDNEYFRIATKKGMQVGQKIYFIEEDMIKKKNQNLSLHKLALVACLIIAITVAVQWPQINTYAVISIDINPSIALSVDKNNIVIDYEYFNEEGLYLVDDSMIGQKLDLVLDSIFIVAESALYLNDENRHVLVGVANSKNNSNEIVKEIDAIVKEKTMIYNLETIVITANQETIKESKSNGKSIGKVALSKMLDPEDEVDIEELSLKEITSNEKYDALIEKNAQKYNKKQTKMDEKEIKKEEKKKESVSDDDDEDISKNDEVSNKEIKDSKNQGKNENDDKELNKMDSDVTQSNNSNSKKSNQVIGTTKDKQNGKKSNIN